MTVTEPSFFDQAVVGEPLPRRAPTQLIDTARLLWFVGDWSLQVPQAAPRPAPADQAMIQAVKQWTGWSDRRVGEALATSHTTVGSVLHGRPLTSGHSGDLQDRVRALHSLVERVYELSGRDPRRTGYLLSSGQPSAMDRLQTTGSADAYLSVIDSLRPRPGSLLVGDRPRTGDAVAPLHD